MEKVQVILEEVNITLPNNLGRTNSDLIFDNEDGSHMHVINRNGKRVPVSFDAILARMQEIADIPPKLTSVNCEKLAQKIITGISDGVKTSELDEITADIADGLIVEHHEYGKFASRIKINNYKKNQLINLMKIFPHVTKTELISRNFYYTLLALFMNTDEDLNQQPLIHPLILNIVRDYSWTEPTDYDRDYYYKFDGFKLLEETYLKYTNLVIDGKRVKLMVELPQHMHMRVAVGLFASRKGGKPIRLYEDAKILMTCTWVKPIIDSLELRYPYDWKRVINHINSTLNRYDAQELQKTIEKYTIPWDTIRSSYYPDITVDMKKQILRTYDMFSKKYMTQATPTLFNIGTLKPQCSSCFLAVVPDDSIKGFAEHYEIQQEIQKHAGGFGWSATNVRTAGSYIRGTNGIGNGLSGLYPVPNSISKHIDQGGNKRPGSNAVYLEPWHGDIDYHLSIRLDKTHPSNQAKFLFNAVWCPDEFYRTVKRERELSALTKQNKKLWYLMDPNKSRYLQYKFDRKFSTEWVEDADLNEQDYAFTFNYRKYIREGSYIACVSASDIMSLIAKANQETGLPYMLNKDAVNRKNNQMNLGTITCSNLCTEIFQYSNAEEIAVCNIMSIDLSKILTSEKPADRYGKMSNEYIYKGYETNIFQKFGIPCKNKESRIKYIDWNLFEEIIRQCVVNLNQLIDITYHPVKKAELSDYRHRAIGVGVQGLADLFSALKLPFTSEESKQLNFYLFEWLYYIALDESAKLAKDHGTYETYMGSPMSKGKLQHDLWLEEHANESPFKYPLSCNWDALRTEIKKYGVRNSLLIALMPTGSTATLTGASPAFEPYQGLIYKRKNKVGDNIVIAKNFMEDLINMGVWNKNLMNAILKDRYGSLSSVNIDYRIKEIYQTAFELDCFEYLTMSIHRAPFIDQGQSLNWFLIDPSPEKIYENAFGLWEAGAKNCNYYVRTMASAEAKKIQVHQPKYDSMFNGVNNKEELFCTKDGCPSCEG